MIVLLNVSNRRKYCTIRVQINNEHKAEFDCLKTTPIDIVLKTAAKAVEQAEKDFKIKMYSLLTDMDSVQSRLRELKEKKPNTKNKIVSHKIEHLFSIANITTGGLSDDAPNDYIMKMNDVVVGDFTHYRKDGLFECFKKASTSITDLESCKTLTNKLFYNSVNKKPKV